MTHVDAISVALCATALACVGLPAIAAQSVPPSEIKAAFSTGKPFNATAPNGKGVTIRFNADGTALATQPGKKTGVNGTWRLSDKGYCATWSKGAEHCYTVQKADDVYTVINMSGAVVARWKQPK